MIDGKKQYQDYWLQMKDATQQMFNSDLGILLKLQEEQHVLDLN